MRIQHPQPPREFNRKAGPPDVEGGPEHGDKAVITAANASLSAADGTENPRSLFPALPAKEALGPPPLDFVMMTSDEWGPQGGPPGPHERPPGQETLWELSDEPERSQPIKPLEEQAVGADTSATRPSSGAAAEESLQQVQGPAAPLLQPPQQSRKTEQRQNEQIVLLQQQEARQQINSATSSHSLYERENPGQQQQKQQEREEKEMQHETEPFGKDACAAASFHLHKQECYDPLKAALESAAAESLLPSLRRYLGLHAEPPPLMPFFLGGPRPPVPFLLPVATDTKGDLLSSALKGGVIRVGLVGIPFLPASVRSLPPQTQQLQQEQRKQQHAQQQLRPTGISFRVLEAAVSLLSMNYSSLIPGGGPLRVQYLAYSSRAALYAALKNGGIHLTEPALPYSTVQTAWGPFPSLKLHAALAAPPQTRSTAHTSRSNSSNRQQQQEQPHNPQMQQNSKQEMQAKPGVLGGGDRGYKARWFWGSCVFHSFVSAGASWGGVPVLLSLQKGLEVQRVHDLALLLMGLGIERPLVLIEASLPELADIVSAVLPKSTVYGLVDMTRLEGPLPDPTKPASNIRSGSQEPCPRACVSHRTTRLGAAHAADKGGSERSHNKDRALNPRGCGRGQSPPSQLRGSRLPGGVLLLSLSEALGTLHEGTAVALVHTTPLGELLGGLYIGAPHGSQGGGGPLTVAGALPWLLEADADLVLPLAAFYRKHDGPDCLLQDPREEFAALSAAAAEAAAETRRLFLIPDDEL
ncbi:hypothetical protein, conserved [Eimeria tenella]|uniref:Uncharacterized protein n=1 Tax=Eimeria tenella TaxID=5802 RepID=U6L2Y2_EIMTE|nr:hypothetical protein, conserved [Eimeria tenella]CDJ42949.1 hypothetical protein, conserved [Eimeria tenella]|eukprot:XP_013233699.1 hypothetical protein, conserved [Eimeria tenella]